MTIKTPEYSNIGSGDISLALHYFDNKCCYCLTPLLVKSGHNNSLEMEHYISLSEQRYRGDVILDSSIQNLVPSCRKCNRQKSDHPVEQWLRKTFPDRADEIMEKIEIYFALQEETLFT